MKFKKLLILLFLFLPLKLFAIDTLWTKTIGSTTKLMNACNDIIVGYFEHDDFSSLCIMKCVDGNLIWQYFGSYIYSRAYDVIEISNGKYLVVGTAFNYADNDALLLWIDEGGNILKEKFIGVQGKYEYLTKVIKDGNDFVGVGFVFTGVFDSANVYIVKFNSEGEEIWSLEWGKYGYDRAYDVLRIGDYYYVFGTKTTQGPYYPTYDFVVLKIDLEGNVVSIKDYGTFGNDEISKTMIFDGENIFLVGCTQERGYFTYADLYFLKIDLDLDTIWSITYGTEITEKPFDVILRNGMYIIGYYSFTPTYLFDPYFLFVDFFGNIIKNVPLHIQYSQVIENMCENGEDIFTLVGEQGSPYTIGYIAKIRNLVNVKEEKYENPHFDFTYDFRKISYYLPKSALIEIYDVTGRKVFKKYYQIGRHIIPLNSFRSGVYFIRFKSDSYDYIYKFIIFD